MDSADEDESEWVTTSHRVPKAGQGAQKDRKPYVKRGGGAKRVVDKDGQRDGGGNKPFVKDDQKDTEKYPPRQKTTE